MTAPSPTVTGDGLLHARCGAGDECVGDRMSALSSDTSDSSAVSAGAMQTQDQPHRGTAPVRTATSASSCIARRNVSNMTAASSSMRMRLTVRNCDTSCRAICCTSDDVRLKSKVAEWRCVPMHTVRHTDTNACNTHAHNTHGTHTVA
jgi:hypothetical protein